ncbi:ImmA/IrrE family metallo-endopeptidase [Haloferula sargassicola]|uniref:IrrE N-terminal-like domain-containing protein n=1 Tax=Haloferula sargassicola TaxID=490096 RepID=A0ABP9UWY5_9BACT
MMKTVIRTAKQHAEALKRLIALQERWDSLKESERDEHDLLVVLVADYENTRHPVQPPTPLEAIRFRMDQMGYTQKDLGVLLGAASRASEVLSGKRQLSQEMMRRLHHQWGIPAASLLGPATDPDPEPPAPGRAPADFPLKQMWEHGYFPGLKGTWRDWSKKKDQLLSHFGLGKSAGSPLLARQMAGEKAKVCPHALEAWRHRALQLAADAEAGLAPWDRGAINDTFLRWLVGLSHLETEGPSLALDALRGKGIAVVILPRLDHTYLDGAALLTASGRPVIGFTLRQNRLDNFWFVLFHELGHVLRHLSGETPTILDTEIDARRDSPIEKEADRFALDTLIPPPVWQRVRRLRYAADLRKAAAREQIGVSVIAGRLRREAENYRIHNTLVGQKKLRAALGYSESDWPK